MLYPELVGAVHNRSVAIAGNQIRCEEARCEVRDKTLLELLPKEPPDGMRFCYTRVKRDYLCKDIVRSGGPAGGGGIEGSNVVSKANLQLVHE